MAARSMMLFGAQGYVGGSIAELAQAEGQEVHRVHSADFDFWGETNRWPWATLQTRVDNLILAASFEKPTVDGNMTLEKLKNRFKVLISNLKAKRIIFLSTDAVFEGLNGPYGEENQTSPVTAYGRCKAAQERIVLQDASNGHVVRMSVVWGRGTTKADARRERFLAQPERPLKGATNVFRSPISILALSQAVVRMTREKELPRTLHLATPRLSYFDFMHQHLLYDHKDELEHWIDRKYRTHDTSLKTQHPDLVRRLLL